MIDEADRLLMQAYQDWVPKVLTSMKNEASGQLLTDSITGFSDDFKFDDLD